MHAPHRERLKRPQLVEEKGKLAPDQIGSAGLTYEDLVNVNQNGPYHQYTWSAAPYETGHARYLIVALPRVRLARTSNVL